MITEIQEGDPQTIIGESLQYRSFKIVKQNPQHLVLTDGRTNMIFKTYHLKDADTLLYLSKRKQIQHESIMTLHKIETECLGTQESKAWPINCGILFQKYQKTLETTFNERSQFSHQEIFQTFKPIKEAIDYMISHEYDPGHFAMDSIVCNQNYEIKFMEKFFHESSVSAHHRPEYKTQLYEDFTALLFNTLFPQQKYLKAWKSRYEIAEKKLNQKDLQYFKHLYLHFAPNFFKVQKSKKIKKVDPHVGHHENCKRSKRLKSKECHFKWQEGKQNKIMQ